MSRWARDVVVSAPAPAGGGWAREGSRLTRRIGGRRAELPDARRLRLRRIRGTNGKRAGHDA